MPPAQLLAGAVVQKVDVATDVVVLRVRAPGQTFFVLVTAGRPGPLVGLTPGKPFKGTALFSDPASGRAVPLGEKLRFRARLEGARIVAIEERRVLIAREAEGLRTIFAIEGAPAAGARVTLRELGEAEAFAAGAPEEGTSSMLAGAGLRAEAELPGELEALYAKGEALARGFGAAAFEARRQDLTRALARATAKVERRMEAVAADLARIAGAGAIAAQASAFVAEASRAPRGARSLTVTDWSSGEPRALELKLDPARPAREQIDAMFKRARRLKQGAAVARPRLAEAEATWERLAELAVEAKAAASFEAIEAIARAARAACPRDFALGQAAAGSGKGKGRAVKAAPYRMFRGASEARILVGRGAAHNDALTFKAARPHDLWLHAKGRTGAHVIVPLEKGQTCPAELLVDAAHLAAHFSDAREEGVVEVQYTPRRYLRKPKGAAPGFVVVDREKVLVLRVENGCTARLLASEEPLA